MNATTTAGAATGGAGAGAGGGAAGAGGAGGAGGGPQGISPDEMLVYWFDIALLCAVGVFFLAFLPRAIGRFCNASEWMRGFILRSGQAPDPVIQQRRLYNDSLTRVNTITTLGDNSSDHSHTLANHNQYAYTQSGKQWASAPIASGDVHYPAHVPAISSLLHPLSKIASYPVTATMSLGKLFVVIAYIAGIITLLFVNYGPMQLLRSYTFGNHRWIKSSCD